MSSLGKFSVDGSRWAAVWRYLRRFPTQHPLYVFVLVVITIMVVSLKWSQATQDAYENSPQARAERESADRAAAVTGKVDMAKMFVTTRLRDPDSAQFTDLRIVNKSGQEGVCGFVNAKNGFGGMTGNTAFAVIDYQALLTSDDAETLGKIYAFCK